MFLVIIPIHDGSNESSEISSETNAKSSETGSGTSIQQGTSEKHIEFDLSTKISRS